MLFVSVTLTLIALIATSLVLYRHQLSQLLLIGLIARLALILLHVNVSPLPDSQSDALGFEEMGVSLAQGGFEEAVLNVQPGAYSYAWFIGVVYSLIGRNEYVIMLINAFVSMMTVVYALKTAQLLSVTRRKTLLILGLILCFHPTLLLYSVIILRESIFTFCLVFAVYNLVVYTDQKGVGRIMAALAAITVGSVLHSSLVVLYPVVALVLYAKHRTGDIALRPLIFFFAGVVIAAIAYGMFVAGVGYDKLGMIQDGLGAYYSRVADARTAYLTDLVPNAWYDLIWQIPIRIVYFLFMPFPWLLTQASDYLAFVDAIIWAGLLFVILRNANFRQATTQTWPLLISVVLLMMVMAVGTPGYGTGLRHRAKLFPAVAVVSSVAAAGSLMRSKRTDAGYHYS